MIVPRPFSGNAGAKFGLIVRGANIINNQLRKFESYVQTDLYIAIQRCLIMVEADAKYLIASGYYKPAIDTGRTRMSVTNQIVSFTYTKIEGKVGTNVYYAIYVHEGTKNKSDANSFNAAGMNQGAWRMPPRRFLIDALKRKKDEIKETLIKGFTNSITKAKKLWM